jgi:hypothetical protein
VKIGDERLPARFWKKVQPDPATGCWLWTGSADVRGYGFGRYGERKADGRLRQVGTHRVAYEVVHGPIGSLQVDHLCRVPACCNPLHLEAVTCKENLLRGNTFNAANAAKTHCPAGHEYAGDNLLVSQTGQRRCRACLRSHGRRYYRERQL